jgi:hypothetical protein
MKREANIVHRLGRPRAQPFGEFEETPAAFGRDCGRRLVLLSLFRRPGVRAKVIFAPQPED